MLTAIIIDDETNGRETLKILLEKYCPSVRVLGMGKSVDEGVILINETKPDVVFLDVEMPFKNGFDLLSEFDPINFEVIFTTAYSQYAAKAFKFSAIDYLLKPIDILDLQAAVAKAEKRTVNSMRDTQLEVFLASMKSKNNQAPRIVLPTVHGFSVTDVSDIVRCEADKNYTNFIFSNRSQVLVSRTLKEYSELLEEYNFVRVHQSHLVNLAHVKKYNKGRGGFITMSDDSTVDVSRANKDEFLRRMSSVVGGLSFG